MKKILKFLKCKDKEEVIYKMRSYEGTQEISGNLRPSKQDIRLTEALQELLEKLNVVVLDHVIIGDDEYLVLEKKG